MGRHAGDGGTLEMARGNRRVVQQTQLVVVAAVEAEEEVLVWKAQAQRNGAQDVLGGAPAVPVEGGCEGAEARQDVLGEPDVGLVVVMFGADFVAFLLH